MARDNRLWGAERIRGELLKLGITVSKRTIQRYLRRACPPRRSGQTWATFLRNIHDNDSKFGPRFARAAETSGIELLHTPVQAPRANALCERFLGSVRRECLDHLLILHERHLSRVRKEYVAYVNNDRPHQSIGQAILATIRTKRPPP